ncbi:XtrA/YqaO family protein [Bacillus sp. FSL R5-0654]|uniref:XtrA/YqaO family protein n=1 Tax=Bacillus sp. FSL R5-0654 TaxID=2954589 RepID=UPI0030FA764E
MICKHIRANKRTEAQGPSSIESAQFIITWEALCTNIPYKHIVSNVFEKGEVIVIILDGHSNNVVLAETPMYGKPEIITRDGQFTNLSYNSSFKFK